MTASGLNAVFLSHRHALLRFVRARGAGDEAEDILQDLWLKVEALEGIGPIADPRAYLFRMADNLMHDRVRGSRRRAARDRAWLGDSCEADEHIPSPERILASRERLGRVERALASLGDRSRAIFHRFRIEGVAQGRIAEEEGISLSAVEKHLQRAYRVLAVVAEDPDEVAHDETPAAHRKGRK